MWSIRINLNTPQLIFINSKINNIYFLIIGLMDIDGCIGQPKRGVGTVRA